jgi:hypothetical protein
MGVADRGDAVAVRPARGVQLDVIDEAARARRPGQPEARPCSSTRGRLPRACEVDRHAVHRQPVAFEALAVRRLGAMRTPTPAGVLRSDGSLQGLDRLPTQRGCSSSHWVGSVNRLTAKTSLALWLNPLAIKP